MLASRATSEGAFLMECSLAPVPSCTAREELSPENENSQHQPNLLSLLLACCLNTISFLLQGSLSETLTCLVILYQIMRIIGQTLL